MAYTLLVGLVGALIVHLIIILAVPAFSDRDALTRLSSYTEPYRFSLIEEIPEASDMTQRLDPLFRTGVCHFDITEGPVYLNAGGPVEFWSVSIYDENGLSVFSFNDRNAAQGSLDIIVTTPADAAELRKSLPAQYEQSFIVEAGFDAGLAVLRVFQPDESWQGIVARFLRNASCEPA